VGVEQWLKVTKVEIVGLIARTFVQIPQWKSVPQQIVE